jgi:hypothetical protein
MSKNILLPVELVDDIASLLLALRGTEQPHGVLELAKRIENALISKMERIERRQAFTQYKTALPGSDERERARQTYLNKTEILKNFRSEKEICLEE